MISRIGVSTTLNYLCVMFAAAGLSTASAQQSGLADPPAVPESEPSDEASIPGLAAVAAALAAEEEVLDTPGPEIEAYVTRLEAQLTLRDRLDHGEYSEAVPVAARLVELTSEEFGERSTETAVAISNLAESQRRARLYEDAEQNFLASVDLFQQLGGEFSESVITPLVGLGVTYQSMNLHPQAVTALEEARTVSRRIHGLLGEQQVDILNHIANSMVSMEMYEEADARDSRACGSWSAFTAKIRWRSFPSCTGMRCGCGTVTASTGSATITAAR